MKGNPRRFPYVWPTWVTGIMSGEDSCSWAPWFKAHYWYEKAKRDDENSLSSWQARHAEAVRERVAEFESAGYTVTVEDQNKFSIRGDTAEVGGKPDILAVRAGEWLIDDEKTGKPKERDYWQVVLYMLLGRKAYSWLPDLSVGRGRVTYAGTGGSREVSYEEAADQRDVVFSAIRLAGSAVEPARRPSERECRYCDIACCPDRARASGTATAVTTDF